MDDETFSGQARLRKAELISPPNKLKQKVGSGGIDPSIVSKAQNLLENNNVDFRPQASILMDVLNEAIENARSGRAGGEGAIEAMMYPAMQLKAQGGMFKYQLISDIANILINYLETVSVLDNDVLDIVIAHKMSINAVLAGGIKGDGGRVGKELRDELMAACNRFYKHRAAAVR